MQKILCFPRPGGLILPLALLETLFKINREWFEKGIPRSEFTGMADGEVNLHFYSNALEYDELIYFFKDSKKIRTSSLVRKLVEKHQKDFKNPLTAFKIIKVPKGIKWNVSSNEDGSEKVCEQHRVWS